MFVKKRLYLLVFLSLTISDIISQSKWDYQWLFGSTSNLDTNGALVNFNTIGNPSIIGVQKTLNFRGGAVSMCDSMGILIYYSNGCRIADASHEIMMNGDSIGSGYILSSFCESGSPAPQSLITLPTPGSPGKYYLFAFDLEAPYETPTGMYFPLAPENLYYHIIDMSMNAGLGSVVEKLQVIVQDTFARSGLQACRHSNGKDWWILAPKSHSSCYHTLLFTATGLTDSIFQCTGKVWGDNDSRGQAVFSPDNKKYARVDYENGLNIFDFNDSLGLLSNPVHIDFEELDSSQWTGVAISSNSRFLYVTKYEKIYQYDLLAMNIDASRVLVALLDTNSPAEETTTFYQARLGPDGRIYIAGTNNSKHLHVINNPDCKGIDCNIEQYAIELPAINRFTMPNFPHFRKDYPSHPCDSVSLATGSFQEKLGFKISPNPTFSEIIIESKIKPRDGLNFQLFDMNGIAKLSIPLFLNEGIAKINLEEFNGMFICRIICSEKILFCSKILVLK